MTKNEFLNYVSKQPCFRQRHFSLEELSDNIRKTYPDCHFVDKILRFFGEVGSVLFTRIETISGDELRIDLRWINQIAFWNDIKKKVNCIGFIQNCADIIEHFYLSETGEFYNQKHELIARTQEDFFDYLVSVEYDFHPVIKQRTYDMLRHFGWYEGRHIDYTELANEILQHGISLTEEQKSFLSEYGGLTFEFDIDDWSIYSPQKMITKLQNNKLNFNEIAKDNQGRIVGTNSVECGDTMSGPIFVSAEGRLLFLGKSPIGRTALEGIQWLADCVDEDVEWI